MARKVRRGLVNPKGTPDQQDRNRYHVIDGGPTASDPWYMGQDKGIYGPKPKRPKRRPVPMPQYKPYPGRRGTYT